MQIPTRRSTSAANDKLLDRTKEYARSNNLRFFEEAFRPYVDDKENHYVFIGFLGSRDLPGVSLRRAQAILRWDLRPSIWSDVFISTSDDWRSEQSVSKQVVAHVPLDTRSAEFPDPAKNALIRSPLGNFADSNRDANVGLVAISVTPEGLAEVTKRCHDPNLDRIRYNFWDSLGVWQGYFWSAGLRSNPLRDGVPIPSSSLVEYCFEALGLDITPGASERNSAPEHLWNAAKFWYEAYVDETRQRNHMISGSYVIRDRGCSLLDAE